MKFRIAFSFLLLVALPVSERASGQEPSHSDLAKQTQNPVGDLTVLPFQFNFYTGGGLENQTLYNLNFQPVLPISISKRYTLIARWIVPYLNIPLGSTGVHLTGIGDILQQTFFRPAKPSKITWAVGPVLSFPTATNVAVHTGDWAAGPAVVVLGMPGHWVIGTLAYQLWTYARDSTGTRVDQLTIQPFINWNFGEGWSLTTAPIITANWRFDDDDRWTVPLGMGASKVTEIGKQHINVSLQYYYNAERASAGGASQLKLEFSLLYPVAKKKTETSSTQ